MSTRKHKKEFPGGLTVKDPVLSLLLFRFCPGNELLHVTGTAPLSPQKKEKKITHRKTVEECSCGSVGSGSSIVPAVALITAVAWVRSLDQELLCAADTGKKRTKNTQSLKASENGPKGRQQMKKYLFKKIYENLVRKVGVSGI